MKLRSAVVLGAVLLATGGVIGGVTAVQPHKTVLNAKNAGANQPPAAPIGNTGATTTTQAPATTAPAGNSGSGTTVPPTTSAPTTTQPAPTTTVAAPTTVAPTTTTVPKVTVPNVVGQSPTAADASLAAVGLSGYLASPGCKTVGTQSPTAGSQVYEGTSVVLNC